MSIVLDSDGLIKLIKSGIQKKLFREFSAIISEQVYNETVVKGRKFGHKDADVIDDLVKERLIKIKKLKKEPSKSIKFGQGEISCLEIFKQENARFIVSDDQAFLNFLEFNDIPFVIPTDLIAQMAIKGKISKVDAMNALESLKGIVRGVNRLKAIKKLEAIE